MGLFSSIKKIYTSVDKAVGGILPGGAPSKFTPTVTTTKISPTYISSPTPSAPSPTPSPTPSAPSGGGSGGGLRTTPTGRVQLVGSSGVVIGATTPTTPEQVQEAFTESEIGKAINRARGSKFGVSRPYATTILSTPNLINKELLNKLSTQIEKTGVVGKVRNIFDKASGGVLTRRDLNKQQKALNTDIESFNKRYGNKELGEKEYVKAQSKLLELQAKEQALEMAQMGAEQSKTKKFWDFVLGDGALFMKYDFEKETKKAKKSLKDLQGQRERAKSSLNKKRLDLLIRSKKSDLKRLENKQLPQVRGTAVPISPVGIAGIPKTLKVKFVGTQRQVGNKIKTDLAFTSSKGDLGLAKGVTLVKGNKGYSIVGGKFGKVGLKFPTTKPVIKRIKTFRGQEISVVKPSTLKVTRQMKLAKQSGRTITVSKNIKILEQAGIGRVATAKGQKILRTGVRFPTGKIIKVKPSSLNKDVFTSISSVLTKRDLSKIIGKTITIKGNKVKFIGLIRGLKGSGKTFNIKGATGKELKQYKRALSKVISTVAGAVAQSKKLSGLTKAQRLAAATTLIKKSPTRIGKIPITKTISQKTITKQIPKPTGRGVSAATQPRDARGRFTSSIKFVQKTKTGQRAKQVTKVSQTQKAKQKAAQKQKLAQRTLQKQAQKTLQSQVQRQRLAQRTLQRQLQRTITRTKVGTRTILGKVPIRPVPLALALSLRKTLPKLKVGKKQGYLIYEKVRGRFRQVKTKPLSLRDAKDKLARRLDRRLSRTATIRLIPVNVKRLGKITKKERGYYNRFKQNLRNYKIVKGKRVRTPFTYIEKAGKPVISTRGEKLQLKRERAKALKRKTGKYRGHSAKKQKRDSHGRFIKTRKNR